MADRRLQKAAALMGFLILFCSLFLVVSVEAKAITDDVEFTFTNHPVGPFDDFWVSGKDGKIIHTRGYYHEGEVLAGDFAGMKVVYIGDLNGQFPEHATGHGVFILEGACGTFVGISVIKADDGFIYGWFTCHGTGDFDGWLLKGTFEANELGSYDADAMILRPHG